MNFLERWQHVHDRFVEVAGLSTEMYTWKSEKSTHVLEQNAHDPFTENALFRLVTEFSRKSLIGENKIYSFKDKWRDSKKKNSKPLNRKYLLAIAMKAILKNWKFFPN